MLHMRKGVFSILLAVLLVLPALCSTALATEDYHQAFRIDVNMKAADSDMQYDAPIYLYKVASAQVDENNNLHMEPTAFFEDLQFDSLSQQEVRVLVDELIKRIHYPGSSETAVEPKPIAIKRPDEKGIVRFDQLNAGVYLLMKWPQDEPVALKMTPALVYLPGTDAQTGQWQDIVQVSPKFDWSTNPDPENTPQPTDGPNTVAPSQNLPQTGMVQWPIPILILAGLVLLILGYSILRRVRQD